MSTVSGYRSNILIRGAEVGDNAPNGSRASVDRDLSRSWPGGSGAGEVDVVYDTEGTATDTPTVIDLSELPSMVGEADRDCGRLMAVEIENTGAAVLLVGGGTTPAFAQLTIPAGGRISMSFAASAADGIDVSTNKNISIECATSTTYRLSIAGRTVA